MNEAYMTKVATGFLNELSEIQKKAGLVSGLGSMLTKGVRGFGAAAKGGRKVLGEGGHLASIKKMYAQGAGKSGSMAGGLKRLAKSPYGAMAGTAGLGGLAGYGGYKALGGGQPGYPQR